MSTPTQANHIGTWLALVEPVLAARVLDRLKTALRFGEEFAAEPDAPEAVALRELAQTIAAELAAEEA